MEQIKEKLDNLVKVRALLINELIKVNGQIQVLEELLKEPKKEISKKSTKKDVPKS